MAKIGIENINEIRLNVIPTERRFDSTGDLAVHPLVAAKYAEKGYDNKPKTEAEATARGETSFNGLVSSCPRITAYVVNNENFVVADVAPTRYLIGQALRDLTKEGKYQENTFPQMSPDMAGPSLVVPVKIKGDYFLLSQIKGKALGSGEVHAALAAGNLDAVYLSSTNPLAATLQNECSEEVGLNLSTIDETSLAYMVDERETGQVSFAHVARNSDVKSIFNNYELSVKRKLTLGEPLEVMALALLPLERTQSLAQEGSSLILRQITTYHPTVNGLVEKVEDRRVRPYTQATLDYLAKPENVKFLLEKAGF